MKIEELYNKLKDNNVPDDWFYLHGVYGSSSEDDKICLTIKRGKYFVEFIVYEKERGEVFNKKSFKNESEACVYLFKRLMSAKEIEDKYFK